MTSYRRFVNRFYTVTVGFLTLALAACSREDASDRGKVFKVALLTPGPISDQSWNGGAYEGLIRIRAPKFPRTIYITTSGISTARKIAGMEFAFEEASYLAGMTAEAITKTGVIGMIGGTELPPVKRSFAAFALGARATNPSVRTIMSPNVTIRSVVIDLPRTFLAVAREVKSGKFTPRVISLSLHDNIVRLVLNPRLESTIPARVRAQVDSARIALDDGATKQPEAK